MAGLPRQTKDLTTGQRQCSVGTLGTGISGSRFDRRVSRQHHVVSRRVQQQPARSSRGASIGSGWMIAACVLAVSSSASESGQPLLKLQSHDWRVPRHVPQFAPPWQRGPFLRHMVSEAQIKTAFCIPWFCKETARQSQNIAPAACR
jgi:hypothetical protein